MSLKIGITGGIGAGKSLVTAIFKTFGIPVYNADLEAKKLMNENAKLKEAIRKTFGEESYVKDELNRRYIGKIIYSSKANLEKMNQLVHPVVINEYNQWVNHHLDKPYTIKEAALLFESGSYTDLDHIILVYAPKNIRINRVMMRDLHRSKAEIERIMENQIGDNKKKKLSDFVVVNDDQQMVIPQVLDIHHTLANKISD
jgi:dephospho-CoA kinase